MGVLARHGVSDITHLIGSTTAEPILNIQLNNEQLFNESVTKLNIAWSELTYQMQAKRDNPDCAREEYYSLIEENKGILINPSYSVAEVDELLRVNSQLLNSDTKRPLVAIFREQGINGQNEMAFAFDCAGFQSIDVHMTDLLEGSVDLSLIHI